MMYMTELGFSAVAIADRMGHESIDITYRYAHLFPLECHLKRMKSDDTVDEELLIIIAQINTTLFGFGNNKNP